MLLCAVNNEEGMKTAVIKHMGGRCDSENAPPRLRGLQIALKKERNVYFTLM